MLENFVWPINLGLQWSLFNFTSLIVHYVHSIFTILFYWNQWRATRYLFVFVCCLGTWFHRGEDPPRHPWKSSSVPALFTGRISTLSEKHRSRRCRASGRTDFNRLQPVLTVFQFPTCRLQGVAMVCQWLTVAFSGKTSRCEGSDLWRVTAVATADRFVDFPAKNKKGIMHHVSAKNMAFPLKWHTVTTKV